LLGGPEWGGSLPTVGSVGPGRRFWRADYYRFADED
jgi:hypothetical protein